MATTPAPIPTEQEVIGLRAELEGAQTQLSMARRELASSQARTRRAPGTCRTTWTRSTSRRSAPGRHPRTRRRSYRRAPRGSRICATSCGHCGPKSSARRCSRTSFAPRRPSSQSVTASHRADLFEREAELEEKVRAMREEFQTELTRMEAQHREQMACARPSCPNASPAPRMPPAAAGRRRARDRRASQAVRTGRGRYREGRPPKAEHLGDGAHDRSGGARDHRGPAAWPRPNARAT